MCAAISAHAFGRSDPDRHVMTKSALPIAMNADVILRWSSTGRDAARLEHDAEAANGTRPMPKTVLCQPVHHDAAQLSASITGQRPTFKGRVANLGSAAVLLSP